MTTKIDVRALQKELNKEFGDALLFGDDPGLVPQFIPTGIDNLDAALEGGIQKGQIILVVGKFASAKSTFALRVVACAQRQGDTAAWIDGERALDQKWAARNGVNLKDLLYTKPRTAEQAFDIARALIEAGVGVVVIDSLVSLVPAARLNAEKGMDQKFMGQKAQLINEGLGLLNSCLVEKTTAVICINQLREKVGVVYGNPEFIPGGKGQEFIASTLIRTMRKGWIDEGTDKAKKHVGFVLGLKVEKSRNSEPFRYVEVPFRFFGDEIFDTEAALYSRAIDLDIIHKKGAIYTIPGIAPAVKLIGLAKLQAYLDSEPEIFEAVRIAVRDADSGSPDD